MRLLIDTNILLEVILEQEKAEEARNLLRRTNQHTFFITDYCLHSIGLLLFRRKRPSIFWQFVSDMILNAGVIVTYLPPEDMQSVIETAQAFHLDFDDAYHYAVADKQDLAIVSFDADFDRTQRGRTTPAGVIAASSQ